MRRWSAWTFASTWCQGMSCHDVTVGVLLDTFDPYLAAYAAPLLVAPIPQQTVPTSAASLSPGPSLLGQSPRGLPCAGRAAPGGERQVAVTSFPRAVWR